jgi:hypothetical protein
VQVFSIESQSDFRLHCEVPGPLGEARLGEQSRYGVGDLVLVESADL